MYATKCSETDDGRKVGIRISQVIDDVKKESWLSTHGQVKVAFANSLHDWMLDLIADPYNHQWPANRKPLFGKQSTTHPKKEGKKKKEEPSKESVAEQKEQKNDDAKSPLQGKKRWRNGKAKTSENKE